MSRREKFWSWLAYRTPKPLVYWCGIRMVAHATTGQFSDQVVPELTAMDAVKRWEEPRREFRCQE